jgi:hypothetical protein
MLLSDSDAHPTLRITITDYVMMRSLFKSLDKPACSKTEQKAKLCPWEKEQSYQAIGRHKEM